MADQVGVAESLAVLANTFWARYQHLKMQELSLCSKRGRKLKLAYACPFQAAAVTSHLAAYEVAYTAPLLLYV